MNSQILISGPRRTSTALLSEGVVTAGLFIRPLKLIEETGDQY